MEFFVKAMGIKQTQTRFDRMGAAALSAKPAFENILELIFGIEETVFSAQGRRGGGSWKRDSPGWMARKLRDGLDPRINHATLALRDAMTIRSAPGQIVHVGETSLELGTDLPQAGPSQRNRPFVDFTPTDRALMRGMIRTHLKAAWSA